MKKILALLLTLSLLLSLCSCELADILSMLEQMETNDSSQNCTHEDEDGDEMCDHCYLYLGEDCPHMDENQDGLCDYCGNPWEYVCEYHYDAEPDGICDYCDKPFTRVPLATPVISLMEGGGVTWYEKETYKNCNEYILEINGVEKTVRNAEYVSPAHGDKLRVKALCINENGIYLDSAWSEVFIFQRDKNYDFLNLGLTGEVEGALVLMAEKPIGTYSMGDNKYIKCPNGDFIIDDGRSSIEIFQYDGYQFYDIGTKRYDMTVFGADHKYEYYMALYMYSTLFTLLTNNTGGTPASATAHLSNKNVELLEAGEVELENENVRMMSHYTEYSHAVDTDYLFTTYMHPQTRKFDWITPYADKILYWRVEYIDKVGLENNVVIQFTEDFGTEDSRGVRKILQGYGLSGSGDLGEILGGLTPEQKEELEGEMQGDIPGFDLDDLLGALGGTDNPLGAYAGWENELTVYTMPFEHEGDNWNDEYKMTGMISDAYTMPYVLQVDYLYKFWYDGGSFATYVRRKEGLYRYTHETGFYVIDKDGNRIPYDYQTQLPLS